MVLHNVHGYNAAFEITANQAFLPDPSIMLHKAKRRHSIHHNVRNHSIIATVATNLNAEPTALSRYDYLTIPTKNIIQSKKIA